IVIEPQLLARESHVDAVTIFPHDPGRKRRTTSHNVRKLLEWRELLERPLPPSFARRLITAKKEETLESWLASLPERSSDKERGARVAQGLRELLGADVEPGPALTFETTRARAFEERYWNTIASLAEGEWRAKDNADAIAVNAGRTGGAKAASVADCTRREKRDLEGLGDHLHAQYEALVQKHGVAGALSADHVFRWETDFEFEWSKGWLRNQEAPSERNIFFVIPGRDRSEAVILA